MKSILEALADNRLVVNFDGLEQTAQYQDLKRQMDSTIEKWSKLVGEDKRSLFTKLLLILDEQNNYIARDTFLYGFRLGAMTTIEVFMNEDMLIKSKENKTVSPNWEKLNKSILKFLAENEINTNNPKRLETKRLLEIDKERYAFEEEIFRDIEGAKEQSIHFDNEVYEIDSDMLELKKTSRFVYGYSLGVLLITEIFQDRDTVIAKQNYYDFPEDWE